MGTMAGNSWFYIQECTGIAMAEELFDLTKDQENYAADRQPSLVAEAL